MPPEQRYLASCVSNLLGDSALPISSVRRILHWARRNCVFTDVPIAPDIVTALDLDWTNLAALPDLAKAWASGRSEYLAGLSGIAANIEAVSNLETNVGVLQRWMGLTDTEGRIILFLAAYRSFENMEDFADMLCELSGGPAPALSAATGLSRNEVIRLCEHLDGLQSKGLLLVPTDRRYVAGHSGRYDLPEMIGNALTLSYASEAALFETLVGPPLSSTLTPDDFGHVDRDLEVSARMIAAAAAKPAKGINILIYGAPGTGKTEFAKVIAAAARMPIYAAGEGQVTSEEPGRDERRAALALLSCLLGNLPASIILFDELEDIARHLISRGGSKVHLNRQLEANPIPIIWTANNLDTVDAAVIRRMTYLIELTTPSRSHRERLWRSISESEGLALSAHECGALASKFEAAPAVISNAVRSAQLSDGRIDTVERAARAQLRALNLGCGVHDNAALAFDPHLAVANIDLAALTAKLRSTASPRFSVLMSGPPGTGKSAFARHLAGELGMVTLEKRASDLFGKYVGETEKAIAAAFEEARRDKAFLIFDEADSLLSDRRDATRSFEISQVNEMLTWMERHPYPFCCTTNFDSRLDAASQRRFVFRIRFRALGTRELSDAWRIYFGEGIEVPSDLMALENLTPGDFSAVRRRLELLGEGRDARSCLAALEEVSLAKPGAASKVGFHRAIT